MAVRIGKKLFSVVTEEAAGPKWSQLSKSHGSKSRLNT